MTDRRVILAGLVLFLAAAALPAWYNVAAGTVARSPALARPKPNTSCVAPLATIRASHAALLASWREDVVRRGNRTATTDAGTKHVKSLATCLGCHDQETFCGRCHEYAGVAPTCWQCHEKRPSTPLQAAVFTRSRAKHEAQGEAE